MKKIILAFLATVGVAAVAAPANAQGIWFGAPGFGVGAGPVAGPVAGPAYGYGPYEAAECAGPTLSPTWSSNYSYAPRRQYGYPASYGYSSDWDDSDVALETYAVPTVPTYGFASGGYSYPRAYRERSVRSSFAYAPSRARYTRPTARSHDYAPSRVGYSTQGSRVSSFSRTNVRHEGRLRTTDRTGMHGTAAARFGNSPGAMRSAPVRMGRGSAASPRSEPASQAHREHMKGSMR